MGAGAAFRGADHPLSDVPPPPAGLRPRGRGRRFWRTVLAAYEAMRADEIELLAEACRQLDLADTLRDEATSPMVEGRVHPGLVELRQVRMELRRTLAQLALPDEDDDGTPRVLPPEVSRFRTVRARKAAHARWDRESG